MSKNVKQKLAAYAMVLPAFLVVLLSVAYPIVAAVFESFQDGETGAFTMANYTYFFTDPAQRSNLLYTLFVVFVTVAIAIVVAYLLALYLRFVKSKISKTIGMLYLLPRFVPAMCAVYAMITIIRDTGLINRIGQLFGLDINLGMMYHASGIITMNLWFNIPFAAMMIAAGLGGIPDSIIEAAEDVGAGKLRTIFRIVLPSAVPGILAGVILATGRIVGETAALIYTAGTVAQVPSNLLGSGRTLAVHMYVLASEGLYMNQAYATAVILLIIVLLINWLSGRIAAKIAKN